MDLTNLTSQALACFTEYRQLVARNEWEALPYAAKEQVLKRAVKRMAVVVELCKSAVDRHGKSIPRPVIREESLSCSRPASIAKANPNACFDSVFNVLQGE